MSKSIREIDPPHTTDVAVIGGGASGALVCAQLLKRLPRKVSITLIGNEPNIGGGVAYGRAAATDLLNVRAGKMSAVPEDTHHFVRWLERRRLDFGGELDQSFVPRPLYAAYLQSVVAEALEQSQATLDFARADAVGLVDEGRKIGIAYGGREYTEANSVVLATGAAGRVQPAPLSALKDHPRYVENPWRSGSVDQIRGSKAILIFGGGQTLVDFVDSLILSGNSLPKIYVRSPLGLLPQPHLWPESPTPIRFNPSPDSARQLIHIVHLIAKRQGSGWRNLVDGLRSQTQSLWQALDWPERRRLLDRAGPYWDIHRHRIPETVFERLLPLFESGTMDVAASSVESVGCSQESFEVSARRRDGEMERLKVDAIVNCADEELSYRDRRLPLIERAIEGRLAQYDPLGLGLMVDSCHRTCSHHKMYAVGALCRGVLWETTSISEIRSQAAVVAGHLANAL
jgi:uncharacterized NAD(P)/FAD-binding protein YdhS